MNENETKSEPERPVLKFDAKGRLVPLSDEDRKARVEGIRRMVAEWADRPDEDPPGVDEAMMRGIDENRPDNPLFRGMY